jgi:ADP-heptose:LPS heptosyltransferase
MSTDPFKGHPDPQCRWAMASRRAAEGWPDGGPGSDGPPVLIEPAALRRVCVFARSPSAGPGMGDLVQRNILLYLLRRACPEAEVVHVVARSAAERFAEFFAGHSYATKVVACPDYEDDDPAGWERFLAGIRAAEYDCCVVDPASIGLGAEHAAQCGIGVRAGVASGGDDDRFLTMPIWLPLPVLGPPDLLDYARGLARALGLPAPGPADVVPPFPYRPQRITELAAQERPAAGESATPRPAVAVHPACGRNVNKRWPLARFGELGRVLAGEGASLVLVGAADERDDLCSLAEDVRAGAAGARVVVSAGESLNRLASLLARADVLVGNDSGPAHIAAALGTPTVVLYGPGVTDFLWARVYPRHHAVSHRHLCLPFRPPPSADVMPCQFSCPYAYVPGGSYARCMSDIEVDEVYRAIRRQLAHFPPATGELQSAIGPAQDPVRR